MLKNEILKRRDQIDALVRNGDLFTITSIRKWLSENGVKSNHRQSFASALKNVFPEYVINNRWAPTDAIIKEKSNNAPREYSASEDTGGGSRKKEDANVAPVKKSKTPKDNKGGESKVKEKKQNNTDNKPLRVFENGIELDEDALNYIDEDMLMGSTETIIRAVISKNSSGREYITKKINELEEKNQEKK